MNALREELFAQLLRMYRMEAVVSLSEFLEGETAALLYLADAETAVIPSLLSETLHLSRARIANILTSLKDKGYIEMRMSERDRRNTLVTLTPTGRATIEAKRRGVEAYFDVLIGRLGAQKTASLTELIREIVDAMEDTTYGLY